MSWQNSQQKKARGRAFLTVLSILNILTVLTIELIPIVDFVFEFTTPQWLLDFLALFGCFCHFNHINQFPYFQR